jgi:hypothetical protein
MTQRFTASLVALLAFASPHAYAQGDTFTQVKNEIVQAMVRLKASTSEQRPAAEDKLNDALSVVYGLHSQEANKFLVSLTAYPLDGYLSEDLTCEILKRQSVMGPLVGATDPERTVAACIQDFSVSISAPVCRLAKDVRSTRNELLDALKDGRTCN